MPSTFWEEHHRTEGNRLAADAHQPKRRSRKAAAADALLARLPTPRPRPCASPGCTNEADLLAHCLPCDIADGYLT